MDSYTSALKDLHKKLVEAGLLIHGIDTTLNISWINNPTQNDLDVADAEQNGCVGEFGTGESRLERMASIDGGCYILESEINDI